ncbi:sulfate reduction electron transfer complex DsrMKJOP subunit DsrM [Elusimicrobiota bacterium]
MNAIFSLLIVGFLAILAMVGGPKFPTLFGIVIPYAAAAVFVAGVVYRIWGWAQSPVPFRIPTTAGQQNSLPWIKSDELDNPHGLPGVIARMALEVLCFRSLFRNSRAELREGAKVTYAESKWLWAAALVMHWSFLVIALRHVRFFLEPVPQVIMLTQYFDGLMQIGVPTLYATDMALVAAATYLFLRRVFIPQLRYISLLADYFPLFLILGIAISGVIMRYFVKVDVIAVKELVLGLTGFGPSAPAGMGAIFFVHLLFACVLFAYFPFSKLMHAGGVFLSPTRNLANNNRMQRHINPWNQPVKVHTYEEYEDEFRDVMKAAELPLEKAE